MQVASLVLVTGAERAIESWVAGTIAISHQDLIDEIAAMCVATAAALRDTRAERPANAR